MPSLPTPFHPASSKDDGPDFARSTAGEEDPGSSLDSANMQSQKASNASNQSGNDTMQGAASTGAAIPLAPGDEAAPGTPGTGENICRACGGTGQRGNTGPCPECDGTGKVTVGIGGA